jgi:DNA gyrase subunit A
MKTEFGDRGARCGDRAQRAGPQHEDLITPTDMVVTLSHTGYIKSQPLTEYRRRARRPRQAGHGDQGRRRRPALHRQHPRLHPVLLQPRPLYWLKVWEVPAGLARPRAPIVNMFPLPRARRSTWCCR